MRDMAEYDAEKIGKELEKLNKERKHIGDISEKDDGKKVAVAGWVYDDRDLGKIKFILVRDITGEIQITAFKGGVPESVIKAMKVNRESVVAVRGVVKKSKQAPGGREIVPESFEVLAEAEQPLPIDVTDFSKTELPKRLDYRFLDLHRRRAQAIFKIQSTILQAYRKFMSEEEKAVEAQFPAVISSSSEGGTDLFPVQYFEKKAYLSQSCQLYKQMLACSMEKVFAIFCVWRAEKHNTIRHLNESRQFDFEMAFANEFVVMNVLARTVQFIVKEVTEKNRAELELLGVKIKIPDVKYLTFAEVSEIMKKHKIHVGKDDLSGEAEKKLGELYPETIVFVHDWPLSGRPFYIMPKGKGLSCGFDAIYRGMEISSGGQRVHIPELLIERLKAKGLKPKDFEKYIESFRYGAPPHAGWGMGLERITMLILGLDNIREAVLFPRDRDRLTP
jgi:aspartyl-tRNA synthetase